MVMYGHSSDVLKVILFYLSELFNFYFIYVFFCSINYRFYFIYLFSFQFGMQFKKKVKINLWKLIEFLLGIMKMLKKFNVINKREREKQVIITQN